MSGAGGMKTRYFPFDGFLSHNKDDGSHVLRDELHHRGARVWHDDYADITDRLVQSRIRRGIVESRFICVCVGQAFRESEWVKIEYGSGLAIERGRPGHRVLVVATDAKAAIPATLARHPVFPIHADGVDPLARFLVSQNTRLESGLTGEEEENRRGVNLGLRSILNGQTSLELSMAEEMRLLKERVAYVLTSPDKTAANFDIGHLAYQLGSEGTRRFLKGYFLDDEQELRSLALDIYEAFSRHPDVVTHYVSSATRDARDILDPLIDLMRYPAESSRAQRIFDAVASVLESKWRLNKHTRKHADIYRWHAKQVLKGKPFAKTREERDSKLRRG